MPAPTLRPGRRIAVCGWCGDHYASEDGWAWACGACAPGALLESLTGVAELLVQVTTAVPDRLLCPHDGCLLLAGERCPVCRLRDRSEKSWRLFNYSDTEHDPKRPASWARKGLIQVPVYDQSEVA